jgi:hypothetical protein
MKICSIISSVMLWDITIIEERQKGFYGDSFFVASCHVSSLYIGKWKFIVCGFM